LGRIPDEQMRKPGATPVIGRTLSALPAVRMRGLGALIRSGLAAIAAVIAPRSAHREGATANEVSTSLPISPATRPEWGEQIFLSGRLTATGGASNPHGAPEAFQPAGRKMKPSNVSPVVAKRQSAISSLRASATIMVLRVPKRLSAERARYHSASALLSETAGSASELDHAAANPSVAGSGELLFPSLRATLVRGPRQAGVARHRFDPVEIGLSETNRYQFSNRRVIQHRIRIAA
jgi:hypothetical protein